VSADVMETVDSCEAYRMVRGSDRRQEGGGTRTSVVSNI
jgi:hypothetical protein